jgi:hypothetical protein
MQVLLKHKHIWELYYRSGELIMAPEVLGEIIAAYRNIDPYVTVNTRCSACVAEFLKRVYAKL